MSLPQHAERSPAGAPPIRSRGMPGPVEHVVTVSRLPYDWCEADCTCGFHPDIAQLPGHALWTAAGHAAQYHGTVVDHVTGWPDPGVGR